MKALTSNKKLLAAVLALLVIAAVVVVIVVTGQNKPAATTDEFKGENRVLYVYNWGEYIDKQVITDFEKKYNVTVNYSLYTSNEEMYTKLMTGAAYDIIIPSDYMIERLIKEGKLQKLDKKVVNNLGNLTDGVLNMAYDPDNSYSVPYLWQTVGIVYDTTKISPEEMEAQGFDAFRNPDYKGHVYMYDSERDGFMVALKALGYSANTSDQAELQAAFEWLREMDKAVAPSYVTDEVIDAMANGEKWMALVYSGDAAYILSENKNMSYCTPKQGTNVAVDAMVIPANAANPELANLFIKFILDDEASRKISEEVGYASANKNILTELSGPEGAYEGNVAYVPRAGYEKDEYYVDIPESLRSQYSEMWIKVKLHE